MKPTDYYAILRERQTIERAKAAKQKKLERLLDAVEKAHSESRHWLDRARAAHSGITAERYLGNYEKHCKRFADAMVEIRQLCNARAK